MLARFDIQGVAQEMERLHVWVDRILDSIIDLRMKMSTGEGADAFKNKGKKDFVQILLELKEQEDNGITITMEQIKALLMVISFSSQQSYCRVKLMMSIYTLTIRFLLVY